MRFDDTYRVPQAEPTPKNPYKKNYKKKKSFQYRKVPIFRTPF
jgi:hypothetical protein